MEIEKDGVCVLHFEGKCKIFPTAKEESIESIRTNSRKHGLQMNATYYLNGCFDAVCTWNRSGKQMNIRYIPFKAITEQNKSYIFYKNQP